MNKKSGHWTNTGMAKFINDNLYNYDSEDEKSMNPFRWYHVQNGDDVSKYRETINGFPCRLILVNDGETPLNEGQNEPTPGNTKDMGIFNFNNDKDNVTTLGFDSDIFPNCASYEVTANSDTSAGAFMRLLADIPFNLAGSYATCYVPVYEFKEDDLTFETDGVFSTLSIRSEEIGRTSDKYGYFNANTGLTKSNSSSYTTNYIQLYFEDTVQPTWIKINDKTFNLTLMQDVPDSIDSIFELDDAKNLDYIKQSFELRHPDEDDVAEDWGFMGVESPVKLIDYAMSGTFQYSTKIHYSYIGSKTFTVEIPDITYIVERLNEDNSINVPQYGMSGEQTITLADNEDYIRIYSTTTWETLILNGISYKKGEQVVNNNIIKDPYESTIFNTSYGLKALIDWVDNCTDEEFIADFEEHFHKDYTLRYFCLVTLIGAVDNLGGQYSCRV